MKEFEIVEKRKLREKHFLQEDGTIRAVMYNDNIHFYKNGRYEEIDNRLHEKDGYYINTNNLYKVYLSKSSKSDLMTIEEGKHYLNIFVDNNNDSHLEEVFKNDFEKSKLVSSVSYKDIFNDIDLNYQIMPTKVKEEIILKNRNSISNEIIFKIDTDLDLIIGDNSKIFAQFNSNNIFEIEAPYMIDNAGKINKNVRYQILKSNKYYNLKLILDSEWLNNPETEFPVIVDPTITSSGQNTNVYDTYIYKGDTNVDRGTQDILKVGVEKFNNTDRVYRSLLKFDLPIIGTGSQIIEANLKLIGYPYYFQEFLDYYKTTTVAIHRMTENWGEESANWEICHDKFDSRVESLFVAYRTQLDINGNVKEVFYLKADLTSLVRKWYTNLSNNGIMLKASKEEYKEGYPLAAFFSKNNTVTGMNPKPLLEIVYRNQNGIERYMAYKQQQFSQGSTLVNEYNGNMVAMFQLLKTVDRNPIQLDLIYNTNDVVLKKNNGFGIGYMLNYHQVVKETKIENKNYLEYVDADGTIHYFAEKFDYTYDSEGNEIATNVSPGVYYDEDGLEMNITLENSDYILKDQNGNKSTFSKIDGVGKLTKYTDVSGDKIDILYNSDGLISNIKNSNNSVVKIVYNNDNITISSGIYQTVLNYTDGILTDIVKNTGITHFEYNDYKTISKIIDECGKSIVYDYYDKIPYKVKKISEFGINNKIGKSYIFNYGFNYTTIIDNKNRANTLIFNNYGNIQSTSNLGSTNNIKSAYASNKNYSYVLSNKPEHDGMAFRYVKNYLSDTSFEGGIIPFECSSDNELSISKDYAVSGFNSLKSISKSEDSFFSEDVVVPKGNNYTFSAYIKNEIDVVISLSYIDKTGVLVEKKSKNIKSNSEFKRYDISIYFPDDSQSNLIIKFLALKPGTFYVDNIQLEEGIVANRYNFIDNSDFSNGLSGWIYGSKYDYEIVDLFNGNKALKMKMVPEQEGLISRDFSIIGKKGDVFNLSFWYKNMGVACTENVVMLNFNYTNLEYGKCALQVALNSDCDEWQYFSYNFKAEADFSGVALYLMQTDDANDLYFTNFCLFEGVREIEYKYDNNNRLVSASDFLNKSNKYSYDNNNQLVKISNSNQKSLTLEYDNVVTDRVLNTISNMGISNITEYDLNNNPYLTSIKYVGNNSDLSEKKYKIRLKGTKKYLKIVSNILELTEDKYSNNMWKLEKNGEYFNIKNLLLNKYLVLLSSSTLGLSQEISENTLFSLVHNDNGSYCIKCKNNSLYLKVSNSNRIDLSEKEEEDINFQFYFEEFFNVGQKDLFIEKDANYTPDGNFIKKIQDSILNSVSYEYDVNTGNLKSQVDACGNKIYYNYNSKNLLVSIGNDEKEISYEYNDKNLLEKIISGKKLYKIEYDEFLNRKSFCINKNIPFITYNYEENDGNLDNAVYGNGNSIHYVYDEFNRVKEFIKMDDKYKIEYDNANNIAKIFSNNEDIKYNYDLGNRLTDYFYNDLECSYKYDDNNNILQKNYKLNDCVDIINYKYNDDCSLLKVSFFDSEIDYGYDCLGRIINHSISNSFNTEYGYVGNGNRTSMIIKSIKNNFDEYFYKYDKLTNITHIYFNNKLINKYKYNKYSELIEEFDYTRNLIIKYKYDAEGNILSKNIYDLNTYNLLDKDIYEYSDDTWEDKLTKFNQNEIHYDEIGNPVSIGNDITLSWINGHELSNYKDLNLNVNYKYDKDGTRIGKIVNGVEVNYYLEGNKIIFEKRGNDIISYFYNNVNELIGFKYNNEIYYYIKNIRNDIIGILDDKCHLVAKYYYDSWGNIISIKDENNNDVPADHIANINPFRYKSYYYDEETKLYYLGARYYNPQWGRFISSDYILNLSTHLKSNNLFSYALNNPINFVDSMGNLPKFIKKAWKKVKKAVNNAYKNAVGFVSKIFGFGGSIVRKTEVSSGSSTFLGNKSTYGVNHTKSSTSVGDSSKPVSGYINVEADSSPAINYGVNINIGKLHFSNQKGTGDNSISIGWGKDRVTSLEVGLSISNFSVFAAIKNTTELDEGEVETYGRTDISLFKIFGFVALPISASSTATAISSATESLIPALVFGY